MKKSELKDLEYANLPTDFVQEASHWSALHNFSTTTTSTCGSDLLLGGAGTFGYPGPWLQRKYSDLPDHTSVLVTIEIWLIDAWSRYDTMTVIIGAGDSIVFNARVLYIKYDEAAWGTKICGYGSAYDLKSVHLHIRTPHTSKNLTLQIMSQSIDGQNMVTFGIRNVVILFSQATLGADWSGVTTPANLLDGYNTNSGCPYGRYSNFGCPICDPACKSCYGNTDGHCFECADGYVFNGLQCQDCDVSCKSCSDPGPSSCTECYTGDFLYKNGTCLDHCIPPYAPRTQAGIIYCDFPCPDDEYIYPNSTCSADCPVPFIGETQANDHFCHHRCPVGEFILPDLICNTSCNPPMISLPVADIQFCLSPCKDTEYYDIVYDTCNRTCGNPWYPKELEYYTICRFIQPLSANTIVGNIAPITSIAVLGASVFLVGRAWAIIVIVLARMLRYVKYINVSYEEFGDSMREAWKAQYISMHFEIPIPDDILFKMPFEELNRIFKVYGVPSSFLINLWPVLIILFSGLGATLLFSLVEFVTLKATSNDKKNYFYIGIQKLRVVAQNFFLVVFLGNCGDFIFCAILDFGTLDLRATLPTFSFVIALILLCAMFVGAVFYIRFLIQQVGLREKHKGVKAKQQLTEKLMTYDGIKVLLYDFKMDSLGSQGFMFFFVLRDVVFNIVIAVLPEFSIYESVLILILCLSMLVFVIGKRPFSSVINLIQQLFWEGLVLTMFSVSFLGAVQENIGSKSSETREFLGKCIIMLEVIFNISVIVTLAVQIFKLGYDIYVYFNPKPATPDIRKTSGSLHDQISEINLTRSPVLGPEKLDTLNYRKQSYDDGGSILKLQDYNDSIMLDDRSFDTRGENIKETGELLKGGNKINKLNPDDFSILEVKSKYQGKKENGEKVWSEIEKANQNKIRKARATYQFRPRNYQLGMNFKPLKDANSKVDKIKLEDPDHGNVDLRCKIREQILKNMQKDPTLLEKSGL